VPTNKHEISYPSPCQRCTASCGGINDISGCQECGPGFFNCPAHQFIVICHFPLANTGIGINGKITRSAERDRCRLSIIDRDRQSRGLATIEPSGTSRHLATASFIRTNSSRAYILIGSNPVDPLVFPAR